MNIGQVPEDHQYSDDLGHDDDLDQDHDDGHQRKVIKILTWAGSVLRWLAISSYSLSTPLSNKSGDGKIGNIHSRGMIMVMTDDDGDDDDDDGDDNDDDDWWWW